MLKFIILPTGSAIVFEKMKVTGRNTRISDGGVAAPNNYLQKTRGIEDSTELFYEDMLKAGLGFNCVGIVDADGAEVASESLQHCLKRGYVKPFGTLTELASAFEMPNGQLEMTVKSYNHRIKDGGQDLFGKPLAHDAKPLAKPPFYAIRLWPKVHYTIGGVGINSKTQVIDLNNRPIPHLFAAGVYTNQDRCHMISGDPSL